MKGIESGMPGFSREGSKRFGSESQWQSRCCSTDSPVSAAERPSAVKVRHTAGVLSLVKLWSRYSQCRKPFPRTCSGTDRVCSLTADGFGQDENDPTRANPKLPLAEEASLTLPRWPALFLFCIYTFSPLLFSLIFCLSFSHVHIQ
jgi:hypothetical protein